MPFDIVLDTPPKTLYGVCVYFREVFTNKLILMIDKIMYILVLHKFGFWYEFSIVHVN